MPGPDLNLPNLKKHIDRFGTGGVMQAGADFFRSGLLSFEEVVQLQQLVDEATPRRRHERGPRLTPETRVRRLLGLPEEEESPSAE